MNPALILFALNATIRLAQAGRVALEDYAVDRKVLFPKVKFLTIDKESAARTYFEAAELAPILEAQEFDDIRERLFERNDGRFMLRFDLPESDREAAYLLKLKIRKEHFGKSAAEELVDTDNADEATAGASDEEVIGAYLVGQWADRSATRSPFARILFTLGSIAAEFVQVQPSLFGIGGNGQKLIQAFSVSLATELNEYVTGTDFDPRSAFAEHAAAIVLRSGLSTLQANPGLAVSDRHLSLLLGNSLKPLVDALPDNADVNTRLDFEKLADAFLGPAMSAAIDVVARHPEEFLGNGFAQSKAAGALAGALLAQVSKQGLQQTVSEEGLFAVYQATLAVVAERPELFIGDIADGDRLAVLAGDVFQNVITALQSAPGPFDEYMQDVPHMVLAASLEAVGRNMQRFAGSDEWEQTAAALAENVLLGFAQSVSAPGGENPFAATFTKARLIELARIVVDRVASTPSMAGLKDQEVRNIVAAVARAMAADEKLLLGDGDWRVIAQVAAREAAMNPGRLFGINGEGTDEVLAAQLMATMLNTAADAFGADNQEGRFVLYGETLREATTTVIRAYSGSPEKAESQLEQLSALATGLNVFVAHNSARYGAKEWLRMFRVLLSRLLLDGQVSPPATPEEGDALLRGGASR